MTDHEHFSELLGPHARGELSADAAAEVERHLAGCKDCQLESVALQALLAPVTPMTDLERARVHREAWSEIAGETITPTTPWQQRLAPYLGVAAFLALLAVGIVTMSTGGGDDGGAESAGGSISDEFRAEEGYSDGDSGGDSGAGGAANSATDETAIESDALQATGPVFGPDLGEIDEGDLGAIGEGSPFPGFRDGYDVRFARKNTVGFLRDLAAMSPDGDLVQRCGRRVLLGQEAVALAGFGSYATVDGTPALILAFATSSDDQTLDSFSVFAFARSNCAVLLLQEGAI